MRSIAAALVVSLLLAGAALAEGETQPNLRFDPFVKPELGARAAGSAYPAAREKQWSLVLTATLVAGERSLANLGGVVLGIGEEINGYRLVEVRAWEAVFEHGEEQVVLPVMAHGENR